MDQLLNLNFMASLRTGNIITDMIIAAVIPLLSKVVGSLFNNWWPRFLQWLIGSFQSYECSTSVSTYTTASGSEVDEISENKILQDAILKQVSTTSSNAFITGAYRYVPVSKYTNSKSPASLLSNRYSVQTEPSKNYSSTLSNGLRVGISENVSQEGRGRGDGAVENGGAKSGTKSLAEKEYAVTVAVPTGRFTSVDGVGNFVKNAVESYKETLNAHTNEVRYLYQPVLAKPKEGDENNEPKESLSCYRYALSMERTFSTLFFPEKERFVSLVNQFQTRTGKFSVAGSPQRLTLLLYGPPGTGKTTLVRALAAHTKRHILFMSLSRIRTNSELMECLYEERMSVENEEDEDNYGGSQGKISKIRRDKVIYMLEDIDATTDVVKSKEAPSTETDRAVAEAAKATTAKDDAPPGDASTTVTCDEDNGKVDEENRSSEEGESKAVPPVEEKVAISDSKGTGPLTSMLNADKLSVKGILNALGGILDSPGRIVVMTTNHIEHLDRALVRPGVITMKLHMGNFTSDCATQMVKHYFSETEEITPELIQRVHSIINDLKKKGAELSPSEVEQMCARSDTIEDLLNLMVRGSGVDVF